MPLKISADTDIAHWEEIVKNVEKTDVPVQCLKRITIKLNDGRRRQISIVKLRRQGVPDEQIQIMLNQTLEMLSEEIKSIDFIVDVESVAEIVKPCSEGLLKKLSTKGTT